MIALLSFLASQLTGWRERLVIVLYWKHWQWILHNTAPLITWLLAITLVSFVISSPRSRSSCWLLLIPTLNHSLSHTHTRTYLYKIMQTKHLILGKKEEQINARFFQKGMEPVKHKGQRSMSCQGNNNTICPADSVSDGGYSPWPHSEPWWCQGAWMIWNCTVTSLIQRCSFLLCFRALLLEIHSQ